MTSIISLALLVLRPKLIFLLTDFLQTSFFSFFLSLSLSLFLSASLSASFCLPVVLEKYSIFYTSATPEVT